MERCGSCYHLSVVVFLSCCILLTRAKCVSEETACREERSLMFNQPFYHINDSAELDLICRSRLNFIKCIENYVKVCLSEKEQERFYVLTKGSKDFLGLFCNETSDVGKRYLEKASCFGRISPLLDVCALEYEHSQNDVDDDGSLSPDALVKKTCCLYFQNIRCSRNVTESHCGTEAADLLTTLLRERGGIYLNSRCESLGDRTDCWPSSIASRITIDKEMFHGLVLSNVIFVIIVQFFTVMLGLDTN